MPYHRKTAPKVVAGRVQRQNRWRDSDHDYSQTHQIRIERYPANLNARLQRGACACRPSIGSR